MFFVLQSKPWVEFGLPNNLYGMRFTDMLIKNRRIKLQE